MAESLKIRVAKKEDRHHWVEWLSDPKVLRYFPMCNLPEIEDAVRIWESYIPLEAILTAEIEGKACGVANLYLQGFEKLKHQCLFAILVDEKHRGKGIGTQLLQELMKRAKEHFSIEQLHLEVYEGNPAYTLYERLGFEQIGYQKNFMKEKDSYLSKIFMRKFL